MGDSTNDPLADDAEDRLIRAFSPETSEPEPPRTWRALVVVGIFVAVAAAFGAMAGILVDQNQPEVIGASVAGAAALGCLVAILITHATIARPLSEQAHHDHEVAVAVRNKLGQEQHERSFLRELDRDLDECSDERSALDVIRGSFSRNFGGRPVELHLVDPVDPVLVLATFAGGYKHVEGQRTSPWESLAARTDTTLVYHSTDQHDVCPHLRSRVRGPMAAVAVPMNATGQLLGVMYVLGPEGQSFTEDEVIAIEDIASLITTRIALIRTAANKHVADATDRLTGLPDRGAMQSRIIRLLEDRQAFTVAVADIDQFSQYNTNEGHMGGDNALQLLAQVSRRTIRPEDVVGRIGGDELLFIFPRTAPDDGTRALERLREELTLAQSSADIAPFTLSMGVVGSTSGGTIEEVLQRAAGALTHAREHGGNRVVVAKLEPVDV